MHSFMHVVYDCMAGPALSSCNQLPLGIFAGHSSTCLPTKSNTAVNPNTFSESLNVNVTVPTMNQKVNEGGWSAAHT